MSIPITPYTRYAYLDPGCTFKVKLRWFPAPPGALPFEGYHLFASGDFSDQAANRPWPGPGEIKGSRRKFVAGIGPMFRYTGTGQPLGNPEWWKYGVPLDVIRAAIDNPPAPPPGFLRADHGPPYVKLECPRPLCWPNPLCPGRQLYAAGPVLVGGDASACRRTRRLPAPGPVLVSGDASACQPMLLHPAAGPVLVSGEASAVRRSVPAPAAGPVLVSGDASALRRQPIPPAAGPVLVAGDASACRRLRQLPATGPVLVAGQASALPYSGCPTCVTLCGCACVLTPLFIHFGRESSCFCFPMSAPITFDPVTSTWRTGNIGPVCGQSSYEVVLSCTAPDAGPWKISDGGVCWPDVVSDPGGNTCSPGFMQQFVINVSAPCCSPITPLNVTIDENP